VTRLPDELVPRPTECFEPWWQAVGEGRLMVQRCRDCGHHQLYPRRHCVRCWSGEVELVEAAGRGTIYSVTLTRRNPEPAFEAPYAYAIVELDEGPRLTALLRGVGKAEPSVGATVHVVFEPVAEELSMPFFEVS
jgi:uncharacterized OB-fold protein